MYPHKSCMRKMHKRKVCSAIARGVGEDARCGSTPVLAISTARQCSGINLGKTHGTRTAMVPMGPGAENKYKHTNTKNRSPCPKCRNLNFTCSMHTHNNKRNRTSDVSGKRVPRSVDLGGRRIILKKIHITKNNP